MQTTKLNIYDSKVNCGVNNEYPTPLLSFRQPCLHFIVGQRTAGKSYLTSKILEQAHKDKTFDKIYIITPSFNSNKAYFGKYIVEENVYEPTKSSIGDVIKSVEQDRDEWEEYLAEKAKYAELRKTLNKHRLDDDTLLDFYDAGILDLNKPKWKYAKEEPPKSLLILDDVLGSQAILQSSGLTKIATLNRHVAPLKEDHSGRSACGLACIILCQTYKMNQGIGRALRENVSLLTLFKNKQQKQLDSIKEELANVCDLKEFDTAYEFCTDDPYGNLTIDFNPKDCKYKYRKNLNEILTFIDYSCDCEFD